MRLRNGSANDDDSVVFDSLQTSLLRDQTKQRFGVAGREPHAAVRCGAADTASEPMDGLSSIKENRIGHRRIVVLFRFVVLVEQLTL